MLSIQAAIATMQSHLTATHDSEGGLADLYDYDLCGLLRLPMILPVTRVRSRRG